ncbi:MAG TPA: GWxTD domain-containing protein [Candidatus Acidoferrum sp.]|nr:GWxTD domain-containing protein [Candidatus Acidoferrum sp.]
MNVLFRNRAIAIAANCILLTSLGGQQTTSPGDPSFKTAGHKSQKQQRKKATKELSNDQRDWLNNDVPYIITPAERAAYLQLGTNEERDQFIEHFWDLRNPEPELGENSFKEEHYRRVAYANEHFSSGIPGWKTDRGHIYILWGPPDEIETHPTGGTYDRPMWQGGGSTSTYPWEVWRYRHLDEIGENIELEFVDPSGSGEYGLARDPGEKDALAHVPGAALGISEMMNGGSKAQRFTNSNGTALPVPIGAVPANMGEFESLDRYFRVMRPPEHLKDLTAIVSSRLIRNPMRIDYGVDYLRVTNDSALVPITLQIPNREMAYHDNKGVQSATLNLYARVSTPSGKVVQTFEEVISRDVPDSLFQRTLEQSSVFQKAVPLRPGLYRLDVVVKDLESGNVGVIATALRVPRFEDETLAAITLVIADQIEPVPAGLIGVGPFVFGSYKVRPRLSREFTVAENLGLFLQVYNLQSDEAIHKSSVYVTYRLLKEQREIWMTTENSDSIRQSGEQVTVNRVIPLSAFAPGRYNLEVVVRDRVSGQSITRSAEFMLKP